MSSKNSHLGSFVLLTVLFFLWGFITVLVDSLIPRLRELFDLSYWQAGMVQFAFFLAYFILSVPASFVLSKIGYKRGIIMGLITMAVGCLLFYPAASLRQFSIFLMAYFTLAGGMTILQVAANPYVTILGSEDSASSRLNLSQAFNSLGTAIAPAIGALFILSKSVKTPAEIEALAPAAKDAYLVGEAAAVQNPFLGLAAFILIIAVVFAFAKLPKVISETSSGTYKEALGNKGLMSGVLAIFYYVGAEVAIGSFLVNYFQDMNLVPLIRNSPTMMGIAETVASIFFKSLDGANNFSLLGIFVIFYWTGAMFGRFIGAFLMRIMKPAVVLSVFALLAISAIVVSMLTTGYVSMWSILSVGLFNSIMFPTIFSLAIDGMGELKAKGSGLLCMAIVGGAVIPPLYGRLVDSVGFKMAFLLVIGCYAYILYFGLSQRNRVRPNPDDHILMQ